jgi:hypothetical protein
MSKQQAASLSAPFTSWIIRAVPCPGRVCYSRAAELLRQQKNVKTVSHDGLGISLELRSAQNKFSLRNAFKQKLENIKAAAWKFHVSSAAAGAPSDAGHSATAEQPARSSASALEDSALSQRGLLQPCPDSSILTSLCVGSAAIDTYNGLRRSLDQPWRKEDCVGSGTYGAVRLFRRRCPKKRLYTKSAELVAVRFARW